MSYRSSFLYAIWCSFFTLILLLFDPISAWQFVVFVVTRLIFVCRVSSVIFLLCHWFLSRTPQRLLLWASHVLVSLFWILWVWMFAVVFGHICFGVVPILICLLLVSGCRACKFLWSCIQGLYDRLELAWVVVWFGVQVVVRFRFRSVDSVAEVASFLLVR